MLIFSIFLNTGEYVTATRRVFRAHFMLHPIDAVLDRKSILLWVEIVSETASF